MALIAIPPGTANPFDAGLQSLIEPGVLATNAKAASEWVQAAITAVKSAPDNPYGDDDEAIAGEILDRIERRQQTRQG